MTFFPGFKEPQLAQYGRSMLPAMLSIVRRSSGDRKNGDAARYLREE